MIRTLTLLAGAVGLAASLGTAAPAAAADHEVKMLNRGVTGTMVFEPAYLAIQPGDTVTFLPTQPSHNAESIAGMAPAGTTSFKGGMNKKITVKFEAEGVYGYKCAPHYAMGMVGLIRVGSSVPNMETARAVRHPGKAAKTMAEMFAATAVSKTAAAE